MLNYLNNVLRKVEFYSSHIVFSSVYKNVQTKTILKSNLFLYIMKCIPVVTPFPNRHIVNPVFVPKDQG